MARNSIGKRTIKLENGPTIISTSSIVGPKEADGPLKEYFDMKMDDDLFGEKSWEFAEVRWFRRL